jgi:DNA-binding GntR family transcriptional regulator
VATTREAGPALVRKSSGEQAAVYIRRLIFDGELRPGDRVPQDRIAAALGMSRIPVREALIGLDREGWVRIEMHRGVFVARLDESTIHDHYDLLALAYVFGVRRAAAHWDDESDRALAALAAEFGRVTDAAERSRVSVAFHAVVVGAARSPRLRSLLRAMPPLVPGDFFDVVPEALAHQGGRLKEIAAALHSRDADRAARGYQAMLDTNAQLVVEAFRSRGLFGSPSPDGSGPPDGTGSPEPSS